MRAALAFKPALRLLAVFAVLLSVPAPAPAAATPECKTLYDLYQTCYDTGLGADSSLTCLSVSFGAMERAAVRLNAGAKKKKPGQAQALVELVCSTGCEDATTTLIRATQQEFNEAFCE